MKTWHVTHSNTGYEVHVTEVPWWAVVVPHLADALDAATGHIFCGQGTPEVLWRIPVGRAVYDTVDDEPWLVNSVASKLSSLFSNAVGFDWTH